MRLNVFWDFYPILMVAVLQYNVMVQGLRDVKVSVPHAVRKGGVAVLKCSYDIEGDSLYSIKWYKGRREFYRYTPKENPAMKIFPTGGIHVQRHSSNESQLTLVSVQTSTSGKYSCEVSADAPSFHTLIASGELEVVEVPEGKPIVTGIKSRYQIGEGLRANCTSRHSKPAANLTWAINDQPANPSHVKHHRPLIGPRGDYETAISGIQFVVSPQHFVRGKLKLRCIAHIHDIFWQSSERSIEEERPRVHSVAASNNINSISNNPYDQFSLSDDDVPDKIDTYMTHVQGDMSSLNAGSTIIASSLLLTLFMLQLQQIFILHLCNLSQAIWAIDATSSVGQRLLRTKRYQHQHHHRCANCRSWWWWCRCSRITAIGVITTVAAIASSERTTNDEMDSSRHSTLRLQNHQKNSYPMGISSCSITCSNLTNS